MIVSVAIIISVLENAVKRHVYMTGLTLSIAQPYLFVACEEAGGPPVYIKHCPPAHPGRVQFGLWQVNPEVYLPKWAAKESALV